MNNIKDFKEFFLNENSDNGINKPYFINEYGTEFYDFNTLKDENIEVIETTKNGKIDLIVGDSIQNEIIELETKEKYKHTIKSGFEIDIPYSRAEIGLNIFGKFYIKNDNITESPKLTTKEEAIKFAKTIMAIVTRNKKNGVKSTRFEDGKNKTYKK